MILSSSPAPSCPPAYQAGPRPGIGMDHVSCFGLNPYSCTAVSRTAAALPDRSPTAVLPGRAGSSRLTYVHDRRFHFMTGNGALAVGVETATVKTSVRRVAHPRSKLSARRRLPGCRKSSSRTVISLPNHSPNVLRPLRQFRLNLETHDLPCLTAMRQYQRITRSRPQITTRSWR